MDLTWFPVRLVVIENGLAASAERKVLNATRTASVAITVAEAVRASSEDHRFPCASCMRALNL